MSLAGRDWNEPVKETSIWRILGALILIVLLGLVWAVVVGTAMLVSVIHSVIEKISEVG